MNAQQEMHCVNTLLDILCYEIHSRRLSPEMKELLSEHLRECPDCRTGVHNFKDVLKKSADFEKTW